MKFALLVTFLSLLAGTSSAQDVIRKELPAQPGERLSIDLETGASLRIAGWDREQVAMEAKIGGRDAAQVELEMRSTNDVVEITSRYAQRDKNLSSNVEIDLQVPRRFSLSLNSRRGDISVKGLDGTLNGGTMRGALNFSDIKGRIDMSTMNGDIRLTRSEVQGKLSTMGGEVLFEDVIGDIKGSSMGGNVVYRNVRKSSPTSFDQGVVRISTMSREINVDDAPNGARVSTMRGDIRIHNAQWFVHAATMGGDITIDAIDGYVEAGTMRGSVRVTMVGNASDGDRHVKLRATGGDVVLTIPPKLSAEIDISLAYTRKSRQNFQIQSDFPVQIRQTDEWDYSEWEYSDGSPRKHIYGKGIVEGGRNLIKIEAINGNVVIRTATK